MNHWLVDCHVMTVISTMSSISSSTPGYLHTWGIWRSKEDHSAQSWWKHSAVSLQSDINISSLMFCACLILRQDWNLYLSEFQIINLAEVIYLTSLSHFRWDRNIALIFRTNKKVEKQRNISYDLVPALERSPSRFAIKLLSNDVCRCDPTAVKTSLSNSCHTSISGPVYDLPSPPGGENIMEVIFCVRRDPLTEYDQDIK